ncbi:MAG: hypothetical protein SOR75_08675 [Synergistes jonesii]|uniref:hypothetical protein n=1 Tax=Synergistes jonesii TaxID=2754 RepID=UPI002A756EBB|nr:hypothetical protein [Synergistes jonesii]MDY2985389.1 hypothetical protein [Synergistes jonesii]
MFDNDIGYKLIKTNFTGFPRMIKIGQKFSHEHITDIDKAVHEEMSKLPLPSIEGKNIAVTAGSRGIPNFMECCRAIGKELRSRGAKPFVVPAMGSHGGGTVEGQIGVLASLGMTEETLEMPIRATMETQVLGCSPEGVEVNCDANAYGADYIVVCGRVKPHTDFRGAIESGLCKMMIVGLGKHRGAVSFHKTGGIFGMSERLQSSAKIFIEKTNILFAMAMIDNAYHQTKRIEAVMPQEILSHEQELLKEAAAAMPRIAFDDIDTLIVDQYGKEISGAGMDPNITGRFLFAPEMKVEGYPHPKKIAVLRLTETSHGNAAGLGIADFICRRFAQELDIAATYTNSLSSPLCMAKIPMVMNNDADTIYAAASACGRADIKDVKIVRIHNTLELDSILVSENYLPEIKANPGLKIIEGPSEMEFDDSGNFTDLP